MKKREYSEAISREIQTFLTEDDWHHSFDKETGVFQFGLNLQGRLKFIRYVVGVHKDGYTVYATSPISADREDTAMMMEMAKFICSANYGLRNGNFEIDLRDGEIRYKCFYDCDGILPTKKMIKNSLYSPAGMFERYGKGILQIIFNGMTAEKAILLCEGRSDTEAEQDSSEDDSADTEVVLEDSDSEGASDDGDGVSGEDVLSILNFLQSMRESGSATEK